MQIGDVYEDVTAGGKFVILAGRDCWVIDDNPDDLVPRSRSHGYDGCVRLGTWQEVYGA